jgi:predicted O-methyltransferase YrrM
LVHRREIDALYRLARDLPEDAVVVEIGSYRGKSTLALAQGLADGRGGTVHAIDPHPSYRVYGEDDGVVLARNVRESGLANIRVIEDYSHNVIKSFEGPIHMLWIDGDHEYPAVRQDFLDYTPLLVDGGVVALHDVQAPGPWKVVKEMLLGADGYGSMGVAWSTVYARKAVGTLTGWHRLRIRLYRAVFAALSTAKARILPPRE